jgi:hypothetical protein
MNKLIRAAAIGFMAAIVLAFIPFVVPITLGIVLIVFIARMVFRNRRRYWHHESRMWHVHRKGTGEHDAAPVDGSWQQKKSPL